MRINTQSRMYISTDENQPEEITPAEQEALRLAKTRPGLSVEEYASGNAEMFNAFYRLIFAGDLICDPFTNTVRSAV